MDSSSLGSPPPDAFADTRIVLQSARDGREGAYVDLVDRFRPGLETVMAMEIHRTAGDTLRARLAAHSDDVLQEAIVKGLESLAKIEYRGPGSVFAYFAQILRNEIHNFREYWTTEKRNVGREAPTPRDASTSFVESGPPDPAAGPSTVCRISEERQRIANALARLAELHREMLILRFFGGASWSEIAERLAIVSPDAARMECKNKALPAFALALSR